MTTTEFEYTLFGLDPNVQYTIRVFTVAEDSTGKLLARSANAEVTQTTGKLHSKKLRDHNWVFPPPIGHSVLLP